MFSDEIFFPVRCPVQCHPWRRQEYLTGLMIVLCYDYQCVSVSGAAFLLSCRGG